MHSEDSENFGLRGKQARERKGKCDRGNEKLVGEMQSFVLIIGTLCVTGLCFKIMSATRWSHLISLLVLTFNSLHCAVLTSLSVPQLFQLSLDLLFSSLPFFFIML